MGFLFVLRSTALEAPGAFERATDMLRKLRDEQDFYDATCVVLADWSNTSFAGVALREEAVPEDLRTDAFIAALVNRVLERTPVDMHIKVRELSTAVRRCRLTLHTPSISEADLLHAMQPGFVCLWRATSGYHRSEPLSRLRRSGSIRQGLGALVLSLVQICRASRSVGSATASERTEMCRTAQGARSCRFGIRH